MIAYIIGNAPGAPEGESGGAVAPGWGHRDPEGAWICEFDDLRVAGGIFSGPSAVQYEDIPRNTHIKDAVWGLVLQESHGVKGKKCKAKKFFH